MYRKPKDMRDSFEQKMWKSALELHKLYIRMIDLAARSGNITLKDHATKQKEKLEADYPQLKQ